MNEKTTDQTATPTSNPAAARQTDVGKILTDLWIHQNNLMWGRLQVLYWVQFAFIGATLLAYDKKVSHPVFGDFGPWTCRAAAILTLCLLCVILGDKRIRDKHRRDLENNGIYIGPGSFSNVPYSKDIGPRCLEWYMYILVFGGFMAIDLYLNSKLWGSWC